MVSIFLKAQTLKVGEVLVLNKDDIVSMYLSYIAFFFLVSALFWIVFFFLLVKNMVCLYLVWFACCFVYFWFCWKWAIKEHLTAF